MTDKLNLNKPKYWRTIFNYGQSGDYQLGGRPPNYIVETHFDTKEHPDYEKLIKWCNRHIKDEAWGPGLQEGWDNITFRFFSEKTAKKFEKYLKKC